MLRLWLAMTVGLVVLVASGVVASMARAQAAPDPASVINAYEAARNTRDIDAALAYFADDATITQRATTFTGKDEIRKYLEGVLARPRVTVVTDRHSTGEVVSWSERAGGSPTGLQQAGPAQTGGLAQPGTGQGFVIGVEAVVQDGKIRTLSYLNGSTPPRTDPALDGRAQLPASVGLAAVLVILLGMLMLASVGLRRSTLGTSTLRGRLMQDLQGWSAARQ